MTQTRKPITEEEFRTQLEALIRSAESSGVNVAGGYSFRTDSENPDWSLELFEVTKPQEGG